MENSARNIERVSVRITKSSALSTLSPSFPLSATLKLLSLVSSCVQVDTEFMELATFYVQNKKFILILYEVRTGTFVDGTGDRGTFATTIRVGKSFGSSYQRNSIRYYTYIQIFDEDLDLDLDVDSYLKLNYNFTLDMDPDRDADMDMDFDFDSDLDIYIALDIDLELNLDLI